ncbi:MAG: hypothetical protein FIA94_01890 [Nitrospirae bacterium]|nr:hypothetical protein [Nitrospirota bacterium]
MKSIAEARSHGGINTVAVAVVTVCLVLFSGHALATDISDNFDDNVKNKAIWGKDSIYGYGVLTEINNRLEYTVATPTAEDAAKRRLIASGPYHTDWQAQIDLYNNTNMTGNNQVNSFGIDLFHCEDSNDWLYAELYASTYGGPPTRKGFSLWFATNDVPAGGNDTGELAGTGLLTGAVQIAFNSTAKVISVSYKYSGGGWIPFGSFGVSLAGGGSIANGNWQMSDSHQFCMKVYGYSEHMAVGSGKMYGDNFAATGVVAPVTTRILQPNGGESVAAGNPAYPIMWEAPAAATKFKLKYSVDNGTTWQAVVPGFVTGTSYDWPVPIPTNNKKQCLVKVIGFNDSNVKVGADTSDAPFTIEVLKLSYPDGGEAFTSGEQPIITWASNIPPVDHVVLSYTLNNGLIWKKIDTTSDPLDDGSFTWTVPTLGNPKTKCKVKIVLKNAAGQTLGSDLSDAVFTINP